MAKCGYVATTGGTVALSANTAKSVLGIKAGSTFGIDLKKFRIGFDGVTASAVPVLIELGYCTYATNDIGTNSTSLSNGPYQTYGRVISHGITAGKNWTSEPTAITALDEWLLTPNAGTVLYDFPLGDTFDSAVSQGFVLRLTAPASVNVRAGFHFERC